MSDYTPTTDEVRRNTIMRNGQSCEVKFDEFDRWLAEHDRQMLEKGWWDYEDH